MKTNFSLIRQRMVDNQLRTSDVVDLRLLKLFSTIEREKFVRDSEKDIAYTDKDILIDDTEVTDKRYMMAPASIAKLLQLCNFTSNDKVLHIAANTGYASLIIASLVKHLTILDDKDDLLQSAQDNLLSYGLTNISFIHGPLTKGAEKEAPFDVIFIEGAVEEITLDLINQLSEGGRIVTVEKDGFVSSAKLCVKEKAKLSCSTAFNLNIRPLTAFAKAPHYIF